MAEETEAGRFSKAASQTLTDFILEHRDLMIDNNSSRVVSAAFKRDALWKEVCDELNKSFATLNCSVATCKAHWSYKQGLAKKKKMQKSLRNAPRPVEASSHHRRSPKQTNQSLQRSAIQLVSVDSMSSAAKHRRSSVSTNDWLHHWSYVEGCRPIMDITSKQQKSSSPSPVPDKRSKCEVGDKDIRMMQIKVLKMQFEAATAQRDYYRSLTNPIFYDSTTAVATTNYQQQQDYNGNAIDNYHHYLDRSEDDI